MTVSGWWCIEINKHLYGYAVLSAAQEEELSLKKAGGKSSHGRIERGRDLGSLVAELASLSKGLSDENRLRILLILANGRKSVSRVVEEVDLSQPLVSHHLRELRLRGLVKVEREGPFVFYEISDPKVLAALEALAELV